MAPTSRRSGAPCLAGEGQIKRGFSMKIPMKAVALLLGAWTLGTTAPAEMFKDGETVVDFHGPMTALNMEQQNRDPGWTIVGGDRVHPGAPGHLMMAWLFLKTQGAPPLVSKIAVDAAADGAVVGRYSAKELERGINLAFNEATPQFKQAKTVARLNAQRRDAEAQACRLMNTRRWMQSHYGIDPDDPAAIQAHCDSFKDKTEYSAASALTYINKWSQYGGLRRQVTECENEALANRRPLPHTYEICASR